MITESEGMKMKEKAERFKEALKQYHCSLCEFCPCQNGCYELPEHGVSCEDVLFFYVETGETENFSKYL
jgi:hypothetical protein